MHILILSANTGEGHNSAARAIAQEIESRGSSCEIVDGLAYMGKSTNALICKGHILLYRSFPQFYGMSYRLEEIQSRRRDYQKSLQKRRRITRSKSDLCELLNSGRYDAVICVHLFAGRLVSELRSLGMVKLPCFFLATDYTCSPGANQMDVDAWMIPHALLIPEFQAFGIPRERIVPTGIPVSKSFIAPLSKQEAREKLRLPQNRAVAVLSCGSMGAGPMERIVEHILNRLPEGALLVAICGNNEALKEELEAYEEHERLIVLGYTHQMHDYMAAADLFITKPGGLSTTEAAVVHTPMLLINAVPGCETHNMDFFQAQGCALAASGVYSLAKLVRTALESDILRNQLALHCAEEFDGHAAGRIYDTVERIVKEKTLAEGK